MCAHNTMVSGTPIIGTIEIKAPPEDRAPCGIWASPATPAPTISARSPMSSVGLSKRRMKSLSKPNRRPNTSEEVNYCDSSPTMERVTPEDTNILTVESTIEAEVLLTTAESTNCLPNFLASYHVTPFWSQFWSYIARDFEPVRVGNSQHCPVMSIKVVELNLHECSMLVLHDGGVSRI